MRYQFRRLRQYCVFCAFALYIFYGVTVRGEESRIEEAKAAFKEGVAHYLENRPEAAVKSFRRANALNPSWKLHYNIGQCEASVKRYGLAIEAFEYYLGKGGDEVPQNRKDALIAELRRLRAMVGDVRIVGPDGVEVYIDNILRGTTPVRSPIPVTSGVPHWVCFVKEKIKLDCVEVKVHGSKSATVTLPDHLVNPRAGTMAQPEITMTVSQREGVVPPPLTTPVVPLPPLDTTLPPQTTSSEAPAQSHQPVSSDEAPNTNVSPENAADTSPKRVTPALFIGATACAVVFGGATIGIALGVDSKWDAIEKSPAEHKKEDVDGVRTLQVVGYVAMGISILGVLTAAIAAPFTRWKKRAGDQTSLAVTPWRASASTGLAITGSFQL